MAVSVGMGILITAGGTPSRMAYAMEGPSGVTPDLLKSMGIPDDSDIPDTIDMEKDFDPDFSDMTGEDEGEITSRQLKLSDTEIVRDPDGNGFRYLLPGDTWFSISVPAGGITTGTVLLEMSEDVYTFRVEHDGKYLDPSETMRFSEPGNYELTLQTGDIQDEKLPVFYELPISFRICEASTNQLSEVEIPYGFQAAEITCNGKKKMENTSLILLDEDGEWNMKFISKTDPQAGYSLSFELDREAPELQFSKPIDRGPVKPPLKVSALDEDCEILVQNGSELAPLTGGVLTNGGAYRVIARDSKGNERSYGVQIRYEIFRLTLGKIIIFAVLLAGLGGYLLYLRRHMQIL